MGAPTSAQAELTPEQMAQMAQRTQPRGAANPPPPAGYPPPPAGYPPAPGGYPPPGYPQQYPAGYPQQQQYPAGYPQQQYPQQQAGPYYAQQPYQQPPPQAYKPPTVGGVQGGAGYDPEAAAASYAAGSFAERAVRAAFIRKVALLVTLQLLITTGVAAVFMFVKPVKNYVQTDGQWLFWVSWVLALVGIIALTCSTTIRRRWPYNLLALFGFTFVMSVLVGCVVAYGDVQIVLIAFGTTLGLVATLTFIAVVLPFDITKKGHVLGAAAMMFMVALLITIIVGIWYANKWWYLVISCIGALLFSAFLVYDLQMVIGGDKHKYSISPDEYVFASVQIYLDVVTIFLYILSIGNIASS